MSDIDFTVYDISLKALNSAKRDHENSLNAYYRAYDDTSRAYKDIDEARINMLYISLFDMYDKDAISLAIVAHTTALDRYKIAISNVDSLMLALNIACKNLNIARENASIAPTY